MVSPSEGGKGVPWYVNPDMEEQGARYPLMALLKRGHP